LFVSRFVVRRLGLLFGSTAALLAMVSAGVFLLAGASADERVGNRTIVDHPTPTHHTDCRGAKLQGEHLVRADLRYANLSNADLIHAD
jgi:uncharacterized protein YjbI with pentapeptide repeats